MFRTARLIRSGIAAKYQVILDLRIAAPTPTILFKLLRRKSWQILPSLQLPHLRPRPLPHRLVHRHPFKLNCHYHSSLQARSGAQ